MGVEISCGLKAMSEIIEQNNENDRLTRDYKKDPLKKLPCRTPTGYVYEKPDKDDLIKLYIKQNKSQPELCAYFGVTRRILQGWIKSFGITKDNAARLANSIVQIKSKTAEERAESQRKERETKLARYGDENYNNRTKSALTCLEKYGADNPNRRHISPETTEIIADKTRLEAYIKEHKILNATDLGKALGMSEAQVARYIVKYDMKYLFDYTKSAFEKEVKDFVGGSVQFQSNVKIPDTNLELDLYIPEMRLAIEVNGNYWHSEYRRERLYHQKKSALAAQQGIFIYHIFEYEWNAKKEQVKNQLRNLLGKNERKIYARKCSVVELTTKQKNEFLEANHLQGADKSSVKLGLVYDGELVSVMTFCKPRFSKKYEWELSRFCSKAACTVVGGASKLFKCFVREHNPKSVLSYSNNAHTRGMIYRTLGYRSQGVSTPNYVWVKSGKAISRYRVQKHRLLEMGYEGNSEAQIMLDRGFYRVYDCGNTVWVYEREVEQ